MPAKKKESVDRKAFEVPLGELRWECDANCLGFDSTEEITPLEGHVFINQPRAEDAIETGLSVPGHLFIITPDGAITSVVLENIRRKVANHPAPEIHDILYVYNRTQPDKPKKMLLPKGKGIPFAMGVKKLRDTLKEAIPRTLRSEDCLKKRQRILDKFMAQIEQVREKFTDKLDKAELEVEGLGRVRFFIAKDQRGHDVLDEFGAALINGCVPQKGILPGDEEKKERDFWYPYRQADKFTSLPGEQQNAISDRIDTMVQNFKIQYLQMLAELSTLSEQSTKDVYEARAGFVDIVFRKEAAEILREYGEVAFDFIDMLRQYTGEHVENTFLPQDANMQHSERSPHSQVNSPGQDPFLSFEVNIFVDNNNTQGAPIVDDRNPTYERLFGEVVSTPTAKGPHFSDHTMIRAGDLSRAEGGYLILPARVLLENASIWSRLRAVLESKRLDIGAGAWRTITPEPLLVNVRLILVGDSFAYDILNSHPWLREDFDELFKVVAEFDREAPRTGEIVRQFAQLIKLFCEREGLPNISSDGVAKILEYACRAAGKKAKLLLDARSIKEVLNEAGYLARKENPDATLINGNHVSGALQKRIYRADLIREKMHELIKDGMLLTRFEGQEVGQINSLVVLAVGDLSFGMPNRITANTFVGKQGIISIDRTVQLTGRIHDKGILILSGYLLGRYGHDRQVFFSASTSFEQSYDGVEGDSASSTELYAILSSLSEVPINQAIAITGSVNQKGEIQPIGGVNQKIEGFFDVCQMLGLTGEQGVMIPGQNIQNLMLRDDVIEAIKEGKFHVYAIRTIDEGMEILTGKKVGARITRGEYKGQYPEGTVNYLVDQRLRQLAKAAGNSQ